MTMQEHLLFHVGLGWPDATSDPASLGITTAPWSQGPKQLSS